MRHAPLRRRAAALAALLALLAGCSIQAPEIKVTGERSLLERQVLGAYQGLTEDLWMLTSLRSPDSTALAGERGPLLDALRRRRFNRDDRLRLLAEGWIGETSAGRLAEREGDGAPGEETVRLRKRLLAQENEDRERLLARLLALHPDAELSDLERLFAGIQADESPAGAWIQAEDGSWARK